MYFEGVKAYYHKGSDYTIIVQTLIRKTKVIYTNPRLRFTYVGNCTPDVAVEKARNIENLFEKTTGYKIVGGANIVWHDDLNRLSFLGVVRKDKYVLDIVSLIGRKNFEDVKQEIMFMMMGVKNVQCGKDEYVYYDGKTLRFLKDMYEVERVAGLQGGCPDEDEMKEKGYERLGIDSCEYFKNHRGGKYTEYVMVNGGKIVSSIGSTISFLSTHGEEGAMDVVRKAKMLLPGDPANVNIVNDRVVNGNYYRRIGKRALLRQGIVTPTDEEQVGVILDFYDDVGGDALLMFDNGNFALSVGELLLIGLREADVLQKMNLSLIWPRYGDKKSRRIRHPKELYKFLYFAPIPGTFTNPYPQKEYAEPILYSTMEGVML